MIKLEKLSLLDGGNRTTFEKFNLVMETVTKVLLCKELHYLEKGLQITRIKFVNNTQLS